MKRLLILTVVAVFTAASAGCNNCGGGLFGGLFRRGPHCETCPSAPYDAGAPVSTMPGETYIGPGPG